MARISTYIFDQDVTKNDYVIGSGDTGSCGLGF